MVSKQRYRAKTVSCVSWGVDGHPRGLESVSHAKSLRKQPDGNVSITDGPYLEAKEYIGGFWILQCANMDEALAWGRKAVVACRVPVEVRAFLKIRPKASSTGTS
jgi:hypothetical protein